MLMMMRRPRPRPMDDDDDDLVGNDDDDDLDNSEELLPCHWILNGPKCWYESPYTTIGHTQYTQYTIQYEALYPAIGHTHSRWRSLSITIHTGPPPPPPDPFVTSFWISDGLAGPAWSKSSDYNQLELYVRPVRLTFDIPQHFWYIPHKLYIKQGVKQWWRYIIHGIRRGCSSHWIQCTTMQTTSQTLHPSPDQTTAGQFSSLIHHIDTLDNIKVHSF